MNKMDLIKVESNWTESSPLQKLLIITDKESVYDEKSFKDA